MDYLSFIADLVRSLSWPAAVVVVALVFRKQIAALFVRVESVGYGDFKVRFREELDQLRSEATESGLFRDSTGRSYLQMASRRAPIIAEIAGVSPRAAILEAWLQVEEALHAIARQKDLPTRNTSVIIRELERREVLDPQITDTLRRLNALRNEVVHVSQRALTSDDALEFSQLALAVAENLKRR